MKHKKQNQSGTSLKLAPSLLALIRQSDKFDPNMRIPLPELSVPRDIYVFTRSPKQMPQLKNNSLTLRFFNLVFNIKGVGQAVIANIGFKFKPGDALLVFPGQPRHYTVAAPDNFLWLFIGFRMETYSAILPLQSTIIRFPQKMLPDLSQFLRNYIAVRSAPQQSHTSNATLCFNLYSLLTKISAQHHKAKNPNTKLPPNENLFWRVKTLLQEKPAEYHTSRQLAQALT